MIMKTHFRILCGLAAFCAFNAQAQLTINVGNFQLLPNTPDQTVTLNVSGVSGAAALDFFVQVADGFPTVPGSTSNGPNITSVDIVTGTLFASNNDGGQFGAISDPQRWYRGVLTQPNTTVSGSGTLATLKIDTTGFTSGSWTLNVKNVFNGQTTFYDANFNPIAANITDGTISIVPEPSAYGLAMGALVIGFGFFRRFSGSIRPTCC
jgi:hypothetical protein